MKKILITLLVCIGTFSCSKDDNGTNGGKDAYKPDNVIISDEPVMYTKNGIIHDQAIMKDYLTRRGGLSAYAFDKATQPASMFSSYTLEFQAGKNVLIGNRKAEIIDKNDSVMIMAVLDSSISEIGNKSWSDSLMDKVNKNGPLAECPTYYTDPCSYRKKYPIQIINGQYYIPYVIASVSVNAFVPTMFGATMDVTSFKHQVGQSMLFNKSMTATLGGSMTVPGNGVNYTVDRYDTLIIQTMRQRMIKQ